MLTLAFEGRWQCRFATDPDPTDDPRGVSGPTFTVASEPDFDRTIRLQNQSRRFMLPVGNMNIEASRTYTKVARAEAEEQTRAALIAAADQAFLSGPWERASLEAIAQRAGVTKQTLLRHFGSKDGLLEQTLRVAIADVERHRLSAPTDDIPGAVDNLLDHYEQRGGRAMRSTNLDVGGPLADLARISRQFHYDWIDHAFGRWLAQASSAERARLRGGLIAICDVQSWWILAHDLGLSRAEVRATLILCIRRLLGDT